VDASRAITVLLLLPVSVAFAQAPAEEAAYLNVRSARDSARGLGSERAVADFEVTARRFIRAHPNSARTPDIRLWLGDLLKSARPRDAFKEYLAAGTESARERAADIAFRHESPPPVAFESWVGLPIRVEEVTGAVTLLVFVSVTHPQTRKVFHYMERLHERFAPRGLRVAGVAAVVDDHRSQTPAALEERLQGSGLPFPVAVDKQQGGGRTVTLRRYRGEFVPWVIIVDRYGRIAWMGALDLQANARARVEQKLHALLKQPTLDVLARRVIEGDEESLDRLCAIRTVRTAATLSAVLRAKTPERLAKKAREELTRLLPSGMAPGRFDDSRGPLRYSFANDRLVPASR